MLQHALELRLVAYGADEDRLAAFVPDAIAPATIDSIPPRGVGWQRGAACQSLCQPPT